MANMADKICYMWDVLKGLPSDAQFMPIEEVHKLVAQEVEAAFPELPPLEFTIRYSVGFSTWYSETNIKRASPESG